MAIRARARAATQQATSARKIYLDEAVWNLSPAVVEHELPLDEGQLKYSLDPEYSSRSIVGDNPADPNDRRYGNGDVMGAEGAPHGTHVAGIIGAVRGNGIGVDGIAGAVKLMAICTVPQGGGDVRYKDSSDPTREYTRNHFTILRIEDGRIQERWN